MARIHIPITDYEAYNRNTKGQYEALGRFIVAFENMVDEARTSAMNLLDNDTEHGRLISVAFHNSALTAKPIFDIFRALVVEFLELPNIHIAPKDREAFLGVLKTIATEFERLSETRNNLVHGTWRVGYSTDEDPNSDYFSVSKFKTTKGGLEKQDAPRHAFELLALADRCNDAQSWILFIHGCVPRVDRPFIPIAERFEFTNGKWHLSVGDQPEPLPRTRQQ